MGGAAITAILFGLGQLALGLYLSLSNVGSAFGATGALVVVLGLDLLLGTDSIVGGRIYPGLY